MARAPRLGPNQSGVILDVNRIELFLIAKVTPSAKRSADYALSRAKHHAPVRKLFSGTTYRKGTTFTGRVEGGRTATVETRVAVNRRVVSGREQFVGHANSATPLFRKNISKGATAYASADFRRVDPSTGKLANVTGTGIIKRQGGNTTSRRESFSGGAGQLTSRGRYEVRSGRGNFRPERNPADAFLEGNAPRLRLASTQVGPASARGSRRLADGKNFAPESVIRSGGRLRDGLRVEGPTNEGDVIWWYIVSDTKDPETGRLYPQDQEFGTRRHKAQPFLRPALHESRERFRSGMHKALKSASIT